MASGDVAWGNMNAASGEHSIDSPRQDPEDDSTATTPLASKGGAFSTAIGERIARGLVSRAVPEDLLQHPVQLQSLALDSAAYYHPPSFSNSAARGLEGPLGPVASAPTTPTASRLRKAAKPATARRVTSASDSQSSGNQSSDPLAGVPRQVYDRDTLNSIGQQLGSANSIYGLVTPTRVPRHRVDSHGHLTPTHSRTASGNHIDTLAKSDQRSKTTGNGHSRSQSHQSFSHAQEQPFALTDYFGNLVSPPAAAYPPLVQTLRSPVPSRSISLQRPAATGSSQGRDDMAAGLQRMYSPSSSGSSRGENRQPMNNVLCRNGPQCRKYQEGTCSFNHDFSAIPSNGLTAAKKSLNVDSPAFTPNFTPEGSNAQPAKAGISPKAAQAAAFTPRGSGAATPAGQSHSKESSGEFVPQQTFQPSQQFNEFVPGQSFIPQQQMDSQASMQATLNTFHDPFLTTPGIANLDGAQSQLNPYAQQASAQPFFQESAGYKHPLNYHLYASIGPRRENLMAYQRSTTDFFIPDALREELQRKSEATLQTFANSTLPQSVEYFHSLVALDTNNQKSSTTFGYPSWIYKATSSRDGHTYALRRIEGYRLTNEAAIRTIQQWKRVCNGSLVQIHDAFTGRWFNDSSLIVVTDYHPVSQTLAEKHFAPNRQTGANKMSGQIVPENDLWGYIVQIANALKTIHDAGLAAQTVAPSKIVQTSKNRLRLNGCGVLDILRFERQTPTAELQCADLEALGRLILGIAARNQIAHQNIPKSLELISRSYTERLRACIAWLLNPPSSTDQHNIQPESPAPAQHALPNAYTTTALLSTLTDKLLTTFDATLHATDTLTSTLTTALENGRHVRLLTKLNTILERPEADPSAPSAYAATGERHFLRLFRDYVFHQVDAEGRAVVDLGHVIACLNKLDAGSEERIQLVSRDEQSVFVVSYRDVKRGVEIAWGELLRAGRRR